MYIQPDVIYSHLLIDQFNGLEPCIHVGIDNIDVVKQSYIEGVTSEEIYTWHSDEKMKRIEAQRDELLKFAKYVAEIDADNPAPLFIKARAAIAAVEGESP